MKYYVGTAWQDRQLAQHVMYVMSQLGHIVTCDWTTHTDEERKSMVNRRQWSVDDIEGVKACDFFIGIFISNEYAFMGSTAEWGAALALSKPCFIIGHACDYCIFYDHPLTVKFNGILEFLSEIQTHGAEFLAGLAHG